MTAAGSYDVLFAVGALTAGVTGMLLALPRALRLLSTRQTPPDPSPPMPSTPDARPSATILSVNVGRPREVAWRGQTVRTAIWKSAVAGRVGVSRLNVDGDAQADLVGHGGEHRAVFVYQRQSYAYWESVLDRGLTEAGQFGENFTVDGLDDGEVCIGDRLRIGSALFEVTQPRVTCFKVGLRVGEPRLPGMLTGHGRPGFYLRVLEEGEVGAGDSITFVLRDPRRLTVRRCSDLLYSADHDPDDLRRALEIDALPAGWVASFRALLGHDGGGNPGLREPAAPPAWNGFRRFVVEAAEAVTASVRSLVLVPADGGPIGSHRGGQFVGVRLSDEEGAAFTRSYSLSDPGDGHRLRISVKREGRASRRLHGLAVGDTLELAAPRGDFVLGDGAGPVALVSAGIGVTPVLAMLAELVDSGSERSVTWVHVARSEEEHAHRQEAADMLLRLRAANVHVRYTATAGRLSAARLPELGLEPDGDAFVCGPPGFMSAVRDALDALGFRPEAVHTEAFGAFGSRRTPHPPASEPVAGPLVTFARSGLAVRWAPQAGTLLELAEACDVGVAWSCRSGVCHHCESGLIDGEVDYDPAPYDEPPAGQVLVCCARPTGDVTLDL